MITKDRITIPKRVATLTWEILMSVFQHN